MYLFNEAILTILLYLHQIIYLSDLFCYQIYLSIKLLFLRQIIYPSDLFCYQFNYLFFLCYKTFSKYLNIRLIHFAQLNSIHFKFSLLKNLYFNKMIAKATNLDPKL